MKKTLCSILALLTLLLFTTPISVAALAANYPTKYQTPVQLRINVGNTAIQDSDFLAKLITALKAKGVEASKIDVGYAGSIDTDFSVTDPSNWIMYDHFGWWDELGLISNMNDDVYEPFLASHVTGYDSNTMDAYGVEFDYTTMLLSILYYDGSNYHSIPFETLTSLKTDLLNNFSKKSVHAWFYDLVDEAHTVIEADPVFADLGLSYVDEMWYDGTTTTAYVGWYDNTDGNYHKTVFQAYEDYVQAPGFFESLTYNNDYWFNDEEGYLCFKDATGNDVLIYFSPVYYGGKEPGHYPAPDSNPDGDNPVNFANDPHIIVHDDGSVAFYGYGEPSFKDFMLSVDDTTSDKHFMFDLDEENVSYHSMEGGGFLFGIKVNDQQTIDISDDTMSGYSVIFGESNTVLYSLNNVNIAQFHNAEDSFMEEIPGIQIVTEGEKDNTNTQHYIQIDMVDNFVTIKDNDVLSIDNLALEPVGNQFGPIVTYANHGCSELSWFVYDNLKMGTSIKIVSKAQDNVGTINWAQGSYPVYINLEDTNDATLDVSDFTSALKADGVNYIGVGLTASKTMHDAIVSSNGTGKFIDLGGIADLDSLANTIADFLYPSLELKTIENIKNTVLDKEVVSSLPETPTVEMPGGVIDVFDDLVAGKDVSIRLEVDVVDIADVPEADQTLVNAYFAKLKNHSEIGMYYLDISMYKLINGEVDSEITELLKPITITLTIPEALRTMTNYKMVRVHDGVVEIIDGTYDPTNFTLTFITDKFSTYGIQYSNSEKLPNTGNTENSSLPMLFMGLVLFLLSRKQENH